MAVRTEKLELPCVIFPSGIPCPYGEQKAVLTDIGTEKLAHLEMIAAIVHQLTRNLSAEELEAQGFAPYYIDHTAGIWPPGGGRDPLQCL